MSQNFLYEQLDSVSKMGFLKKEIPDFVVENLNPVFGVREYQKEAFGRFFYCYNNDFENKGYPLHFLFNMATGSGKTLIMAGLILYLYDKGYRNFLFFVNSNNIIEKTKDNFLNNISNKYLFNQKIVFNDKNVNIAQVDNFEGVSDNDINICFTTVQKLHSDLLNEKENSLTFEDFRDKKIVLISDEAHHTQAGTKKMSKKQTSLFEEEKGVKNEKPSWENTVEKIFHQNSGNLLLEFTATMDFLNKDIVDKYKNKVIYKYDLKEFRNDGFSKDVELLHTDTDKKDRIIQAIVLSQYRQEVASKNKINLKPVILFKAQKTIAQSQKNKELFHGIIDNLSVKDIDSIRKKTDVEILQKAFNFFKNNDIVDSILVRKIKDGFAENKCIDANKDEEIEQQQLLLNSLEDKDNQVRAIFAVQKLSEGWDVLNLFDIVRLYETRDGKNNRPGKGTISEAQLIGRGARYFPFKIKDGDDKYKRKFDKDLENEMRILEELHYHSHNESRYISEIKTALKEEGLIDEDEIEVELKLKESFKENKFYKSGLVYKNERIITSYDGVKSIKDLGVSRKNIDFSLMTGGGEVTAVFTDDENYKLKRVVPKEKVTIRLGDMERHVIKNALAKNDFYDFSSLKRYFPKLTSINEFIESRDYLANLSIIFEGLKDEVKNVSNTDKFWAVLKLINEIEKEIKSNITEYKGTEKFKPVAFEKQFVDKRIKIKKGNERLDGQEDYLKDKDWYVFDANYGTSEEKSFVEFIEKQVKKLDEEFKEFFLVRNERQLKIYNFKDGQAFEPDFLLFLLDKSGDSITYQLFIEPKGKHLAEHDKWKEDFMKEIQEKFKDKIMEFSKSKKYKVLAVPMFYRNEEENVFEEEFYKTIK